MLFLFLLLLLVLFLFPFFRFLFLFFFFNNFVPVPSSSKRICFHSTILSPFLQFYKPAIAFPFSFIAAQKLFFVSMLDVGMQKFPGRREDIEESWMEITKGWAFILMLDMERGCPDPLSFRMWHRMEARAVFNYTQGEANLPVFLWSRALFPS